MECLNKIHRAQSEGTVVQRGMPLVRPAEIDRQTENNIKFQLNVLK
jgi:hypothetical protein